MARPPLPIGTWGRISTKVMKTDTKGKPVSVRAKTNFRDHDGQVRDVTAYAKTATAAERALLKKLQDRAKTGQGGELTAMHKINHLIDLWITKFGQQIADGTRSPTSLDTYLRAIKNHVRPALGELRIGEATTPRIDTVISKIKKNAGPPTAKTCRAIISGLMQLAVRYGAITVNPVREVESIEHPAKKPARAIQTEEITLLRKHLATDETAVRADLPDLVTFMLGTGVRIGESLAILWSQVDLEAATVDITHTIVRIKGEGLIRKPGKSRTSNRQVGLPNWLIATLRTRAAAGIRLDDPVFPDTTGGHRDPNNVRRSLRTALAPVGNSTRRNLGQALRALPPRSRPHSRRSSQGPELAQDQNRTHRNRPHQGRPHRGHHPSLDLRSHPRDNRSLPIPGRRSRRTGPHRHPHLDHLPRLPQNRGYRARQGRPISPRHRQPTGPLPNLHDPGPLLRPHSPRPRSHQRHPTCLRRPRPSLEDCFHFSVRTVEDLARADEDRSTGKADLSPANRAA
ncbi:hypothetical protein GCM10009554_36640 [Kribbella koreensis]|uniref:Phage integrase central domain-containing protein n=1 Tax=Kribbella koreensis TaxID=57909 RepID=A0ABN1QJ63_9ACTN